MEANIFREIIIEMSNCQELTPVCKTQMKEQGKNNENTEKISHNHVITFNSSRYNLYFN